MSAERNSIRIVLLVLFLGLLTTPFVIRQRQSDTGSTDSIQTSKESALERYGFYMEEVSGQAGIDFLHVRPVLDPKLDHILPSVASMGASVSVVDFNNDGWQDLYFTNSLPGKSNALYRNNGDGTFTDVAAEMGLADLNSVEGGVSMGSVWGDFNNSGYEDLLLYKWGRSELWQNDNGEGFTNVTNVAGLPEWANINTAIWLDVNNDGYLDLFMGGSYREDVNLWQLNSTRMMPESFEYARNGGRNYLLLNQGDGIFEEVGEEYGVASRRWTLAAGAVDLNGSGYPDLIVANDYGVDELYINIDGERFEEVSNRAGLGFVPKSGMNVSFGDIMNRGELSIYVSNISEPGVLLQGNNLWVPVTEQKGMIPEFRNLAGTFGVELGGWSYGAQFVDLNLDGFQDLYVGNGYVSLDRDGDYWYDFSRVAGGNRTIIEDAANWPPMANRSHAGHQMNRLWLNDGAGRFQEVSSTVGAELELDSRGVAYADLWNRGVHDLIISNQNGPVRIYRNTVVPERNWISFDLEGTRSNRSAIGAEVVLHWAGRKQKQVVTGGIGFSSQNQRPLLFGLGEHAGIERAEIRWPSGTVQSLEGLEVNYLHHIMEPLSDSSDQQNIE
ncbi:MAG: CRTAC1 family protein [Balneolaceae bacterium]